MLQRRLIAVEPLTPEPTSTGLRAPKPNFQNQPLKVDDCVGDYWKKFTSHQPPPSMKVRLTSSMPAASREWTWGQLKRGSAWTRQTLDPESKQLAKPMKLRWMNLLQVSWPSHTLIRSRRWRRIACSDIVVQRDITWENRTYPGSLKLKPADLPNDLNINQFQPVKLKASTIKRLSAVPWWWQMNLYLSENPARNRCWLNVSCKQSELWIFENPTRMLFFGRKRWKLLLNVGDRVAGNIFRTVLPELPVQNQTSICFSQTRRIRSCYVRENRI
jgi:hypothetical protein